MKLLLTMLLFANIAQARCFPETNQLIGVNAKSGVTQASFNAAVAAFEKVWKPLVIKEGAYLQINKRWSDGTINADMSRQGRYWVMNMYGGLVRYPGMTIDGVTAIMCHELYHQMGGAPRYDRNTDWAAVEGQADYGATLVCLRKLGLTSERSKAASQTVANVLAKLGGEAKPNALTPSKSVVRSTYEDHPRAQCRLDTMLMGVACPKGGRLSQVDPKVNTCFEYPTATSYSLGSRPRCWFAP